MALGIPYNMTLSKPTQATFPFFQFFFNFLYVSHRKLFNEEKKASNEIFSTFNITSVQLNSIFIVLVSVSIVTGRTIKQQWIPKPQLL